MLQIGKIGINIRNLLVIKGKNSPIKLRTDSKNKNNIPNNALDAVPSLKDMEFSWTDDY
jgi:hypothetical protein